MTAIAHSTSTHPHGRLLRTGVLAGVAASVATVAIAALAEAADVALEVDDKPIPLVAFAFWTIVATAAGAVIAAIVRRRRPFIAITLAATALSLIPATIAPDDTSTSVVLVGTHLAAAAIVIPALSRAVGAR
jgi:hypothetical protein